MFKNVEILLRIWYDIPKGEATMKRKITIISALTIVLLLTMSLLVSCSKTKILETDYYEAGDFSTISIQFVNKIDVHASSLSLESMEDIYWVGGVFDSNGKSRDIIEFNIDGTWKGKSTYEIDKKGVTINFIVLFKGNFEGCVIRIWYMDKKTAKKFNDTVKIEGTDEVDLLKGNAFIKNNATILEWAL